MGIKGPRKAVCPECGTVVEREDIGEFHRGRKLFNEFWFDCPYCECQFSVGFNGFYLQKFKSSIDTVDYIERNGLEDIEYYE